MQPRSRTVKESQTDQEREGKVLVSEGEGEQRRKGGINLVKGNIWSIEVFFAEGKIVVGGAGETTHI